MRHVVAAAVRSDRGKLRLRRLLRFGGKDHAADERGATQRNVTQESMPENGIHVSSLKTIRFKRATVARAPSKVKIKSLARLLRHCVPSIPASNFEIEYENCLNQANAHGTQTP